MNEFNFILAIFLLMTSCKYEPNNVEFKESRLSKDLAIVKVKTKEVKSGEFDMRVLVKGIAEPEIEADIRARIPEEIVRLNIYNGKKVSKGDTLALLNDNEFKIQYKKALEDYLKNFQEYEASLVEYNLLDSGSNNKLKNILKIKHEVGKYKFLLEETELKLSYTSIQSPVDGIISNLNHKQYQFIESDKSLCTVYSNHSMLIKCRVLESDALRIKKGQAAVVKVVGNDIEIKAKVVEVDPSIDEHGMFQVWVKTTEQETNLIKGMHAMVELQIPVQNALVIPKEAILMRSGKEVVFTYENGKAKWNYVKIVQDNGDEVMISEDLKYGRNVIVSNNLHLSHDSPVALIK
ncbi:efflux RND transporter periplasmic adaptor subunit [Aureibacter tunicatorum]|uniref:RND family efflux transporter MFP subunit n=1 Tax=Aureibacter tunicatorum TaxID=866807 RepID=A0AAE3XT19_9BACT|nr:efflux RND transporter periplasmic adaptor subunit [Aureibacter tunicatorum]MDR6241351.1 RND family efflux transporter MFP subunit [Aureibacter tunicatorum]BDD03610.1 cation transporter [Aureibacter tunicatorum]